VSSDVTRLLVDWRNGDAAALESLIPLVYRELRRRAKGYLSRERLDHTLQPTALINEVYLRLVGSELPEWQNRAHFFAIASRVMRRILVEHARRHAAGKRGSGAEHVDLDDVVVATPSGPDDLLALDEALSRLMSIDERKCRIVEMRYFGGCTTEETAEALGISVITVMRETRVAQAWLRRALRGEEPSSEST
jgi:RNA polymerase sigma factor (TIGR02999 family)